MAWFPNIPVEVGCSLGLNVVGGSSFSLNSSNARIAFVRRMSIGGQLQTLRFRISGVTGSPAAGDILCQLYSDGGTAPGSPIGNEVQLSLTPTGGGYYEFDFSSQNISISRGSRYWFVIRNANSTPASNYVTVYDGNDNVGATVANNLMWGATYTSTDGGTTYSARGTNRQAFLVILGNAAEGICYSSQSTTSASYGSTMRGVKFTTPAYAKLRVAAAAFLMAVTGSPTNTEFRIYGSSSTPLASASIPVASDLVVGFFPDVVELDPNTTYRLTMACSGDASNNIALRGTSIDSNSPNLDQLPLNSRLTSSTDGGSSWSESTTTYPTRWYLILDASQPFAAVGGGSSGGFPFPPHVIIT